MPSAPSITSHNVGELGPQSEHPQIMLEIENVRDEPPQRCFPVVSLVLDSTTVTYSLIDSTNLLRR
jgi:hypothetical protein